MEILYVLIPLSIILVALAIAIFGWAVKNGQYDDLEGPAHSILYDDDKDMIPGPDDKPRKKAASAPSEESSTRDN
jgi:cbb3-type cytochrome oxidase maturation protein